MVYSEEALDLTFHALSDPTRRGMLARLARGDAAISELARPYAMTLPAAAKHLRVLERAGLAVVRREGRIRRCRLVAQPLKEAAQWVEFYRQFWEAQFDQLAKYLDEATPTPDDQWQSRQTPRPDRSPRRAPSRSGESSTRRPKGSSRRGRRRKS